MADAKQKRNEQLKRWLGSETDLEPPVIKKKKTKVKFDEGAVFLAACSSGDTEEVLRLLERGADINYANIFLPHISSTSSRLLHISSIISSTSPPHLRNLNIPVISSSSCPHLLHVSLISSTCL
ncbi:hypothetical protein HF521_007511 [Silurus meridionalis]|uniref:Protein phosphatase 1 regulatory subunit 12A n=1 Tax=Silurus meridionalis TaxID=175797 RepID=A0A8T0ART2_SILME|nr:hypothetical protein HF521_007511 [Silurus meridionalis]